MSFWDDLGDAASNAISEAAPSIAQSATDYFKTQVLGIKQTTTPTAPTVTTPVQTAASFASQNMTTILLVGIGILGFILFAGRGRR